MIQALFRYRPLVLVGLGLVHVCHATIVPVVIQSACIDHVFDAAVRGTHRSEALKMESIAEAAPVADTQLVSVKARFNACVAEKKPFDGIRTRWYALAKIGEAVMAKGGTVPPEVGEAASKALKSPREEVVDSAKDLLKRLRKGAGSAVPGLSALLNESLASPTPGPGSDLASLLGDVGPGSAQAADAITVLISALGAKAPETRKSALVALGRFGPEAARALPEIKKLGETEKDLTPDIKTATDRIEGKIPADAPRRKGGRRGGGAPKGA